MNNMTVLIIEDEELAANELQNTLRQLEPTIEIVAVLGTVKSAVQWLKDHQVDLIFMDIHLGDGDSFQIFQQVTIKCPVIFTTAYDEYTMKAFKHQGIDYLLKPFDKEDVQLALQKLKNINDSVIKETEAPVVPVLPLSYAQGKERFMVNMGTRLKTILVGEVAYFMADDKYLFLITRDGQSYIIEETITSLEPQLSTKDFFRINRKFIVSLPSIKEMYKLSRNRVRIILDPIPETDMMITVSEDRAEAFKTWLNL
ncbi:response regulator of the LytR/AlgR family [Solitalea canadensis DSM 3403]|uniref:Response regulator of the LytR/AlgR family n=2 Tax=Solitalea canadensis TaxID=995 RepID=H8KY23_SOLCM|nr:response regulator of the LytR/AlgR family [Solitalea canadensis DSM 3403]